MRDAPAAGLTGCLTSVSSSVILLGTGVLSPDLGVEVVKPGRGAFNHFL